VSTATSFLDARVMVELSTPAGQPAGAFCGATHFGLTPSEARFSAIARLHSEERGTTRLSKYLG
jgi:hypothetical protein